MSGYPNSCYTDSRLSHSGITREIHWLAGVQGPMGDQNDCELNSLLVDSAWQGGSNFLKLLSPDAPGRLAHMLYVWVRDGISRTEFH